MEATIFFTHIKKTAGTSVKRSVLDPHISESEQHRPQGYRCALTTRGNFDLIEGHFPYGVHYLYGIVRPRYFVMLREPVDRLTSHYYFIKRCTSSTYTHPNVQYAEENDLAEFYKRPGFQNLQTRVVAGLVTQYAGRYLSLNGSLGKVVLRRAKRNLIERYEAFGLKERFEDSVRLFASCLGVQPEWANQHHKSTSNRPSVADLSEHTRQSLRKSNALDVKLYEFARDRFEDQIPS